jgi:hypothetical protein
MKTTHLIGLSAILASLVGCGGESAKEAPEINLEVEVERIIIEGPEAPEDNITTTALPITENFDTPADVGVFYSSAYAALSSESASDDIDNFYHSTAGAFELGVLNPDRNNWITGDADPGMRLGNARFTIGQIVSVHVPESAEDPRKNTTPGSLTDTTTSWGELDLSQSFNVSFCVVARSEGGNFFIYVDNNSTSSGNSIHGSASRAVNVPQSTLVAGQRASFDIDVGTSNSFIQLRADSGGWVVLDDLVIENTANPAPAQPDCSVKTTNYTMDINGDDAVPAPPEGTPFAGLPAVGSSFDVDFSVGIDNFFGGDDAEDDQFVSISDDAADPFYKVTSGSSRISIADNKLSMNNARFTIGDKGTGTSDSTQPDGDIDLSSDYRITMVISEFTDADPDDALGKFQVYIDNNTSSSGSSTHGGDSKVSEIEVGEVTLPYTLVLEPEIGTENSFIQVRADSRVGNLTIDSISIEYLAAPAVTIDWNVFNADASPLATDSLTLADGSTTEFSSSSSRPDGSDYFTDNMDGTVLFDTESADAATDPRLYARYVWDAPTAPVYPRNFTVLMGVTGNPDTTDARVLEMDLRLSDGTSGSRIKTILRSDGSNQGIQVENIDGSDDPNAYDAANPYDDYRIYQVSVALTSATTGTVSVYEAGNDTPLITHTGTLNSTSDNYIRFGEASSSDFQGTIDFIIWTEDGAYLPSELVGLLPAGIGVITGYEAP